MYGSYIRFSGRSVQRCVVGGVDGSPLAEVAANGQIVSRLDWQSHLFLPDACQPSCARVMFVSLFGDCTSLSPPPRGPFRPRSLPLSPRQRLCLQLKRLLNSRNYHHRPSHNLKLSLWISQNKQKLRLNQSQKLYWKPRLYRSQNQSQRMRLFHSQNWNQKLQ